MGRWVDTRLEANQPDHADAKLQNYANVSDHIPNCLCQWLTILQGTDTHSDILATSTPVKGLKRKESPTLTKQLMDAPDGNSIDSSTCPPTKRAKKRGVY
jgi:hypothetical protein